MFNNVDIDDIINDLKCSYFLLDLQKALQTEVKKPSLYSGDVKKHIKKFLKESGYSIEIQNVIFKVFVDRYLGITPCKNGEVETLDYIRKAQKSWEKCIVKSINSMCTELSLPLSRKRAETDQNDLRKKFESMTLGAEYNDQTYTKLRPVYSSADFFEVLVGVKNPNYSTGKNITSHTWNMIQAQLYTPDMMDIRKQYHGLAGSCFQLGVDDHEDSPFQSDWLKVGQKVISKNHMAAARQYIKQGCSPGLRKQLWSALLGVHISESDVLYYEQLKTYVFEYDMLVDYLIMKDVRLTATNDDSFFVFEDVLYQVLLIFSRDTWLLEHFNYSTATPPKSYIRGKLGVEEFCVHYPPCGIFPFHGFSMMAAPLCYIFDKPVELYYIFRYLYTRYFFRLHTISSHREGILSLCTLFEKLLQSEESILYQHLDGIGAKPLKLVFNWFLFAYSGYLATEEILQVWDRILGYDSLHLLSVLAVAIISYRKENLLSIDTPSAAEAVLADISTIKVIPVLMRFLSNRRF